MQRHTTEGPLQPLALSTSWGVGRFAHLQDFFSSGQKLGFQRFELNHAVDSAMLAGVDLSAYEICSVHEPCPADRSPHELEAGGWLVSSTDEEKRRLGMQAVQRSVDLAHEVGAWLVVVHPGRVDVDKELEDALWELVAAGQAETPACDAARSRLVAARAARAPANLDAALRSMRELADYAGRLGVRLGVENRYHVLDIPLLEEMQPFLSLVGDMRIGFLYDVGHAQVLDYLGFGPHQAWLERFGQAIVGAHLHDVRGLQDHRAPGQGVVDWEMVARHLPPGALRTCELHWRVPPDEVAAGVQVLVDTGCM